MPELLKAVLNVVVAEERALDGPEDLTHETTAQIGLYAHLGQDSRTSCNRLGALTPATPPLGSSRPDGVPHMRPSTPLYGCAECSGRFSNDKVLEAAGSSE
jgi:hypothetical protein